jgi:hypothetical protein
VASWDELPRLTKWLVAASAGGAALVGAAAAVSSVASCGPAAQPEPVGGVAVTP